MTFRAGATVAAFGTIYNVIVTRYFVKRRFLALALSSIGSPFGTLTLAPFLQYLIDVYGWRGAMLLLGGMTLNCAVASALYRPIRLKIDQKQPDQQCAVPFESAKRLVKLPRFWLLCAIHTLVFSGWIAYLRFLVPYAQDVLGVEPMKASLLLSIYSVVSVARLAYGALGDRKSINVVWLLTATSLLSGVISASVWFVHDYVGLLINTVAHSLVSCGIHILYISVIVQVVGEADLTLAFTGMGFCYGVFGSGIVPLIGLFKVNAYNYTFSLQLFVSVHCKSNLA